MAGIETTYGDSVPLTTDEKEQLMDLYETKVRDMKRSLPVIFVFIIVLMYSKLMFPLQAIINDIFFGARRTWLVDQNFLSGSVYKLCFAVLLSGWIGWVTYRKLTLPFKEDAADGRKRKVPFKVVLKQFYPMTGQYMVQISSMRRLLEVDAATYSGCEQGGELYLYQATRSKYVFNPADSFEQGE